MAEPQSYCVDEPIEILPFDHAWTETFRKEAPRIHVWLLNRVLGIEHIGSTAIPGLRSKPVVDIMVGVEPRSLRMEILGPLLSEYESLGDAGVPGRLYFRKRGSGAINVHVVEYGGERWVNNLLLREYLRTHPQEAERYGRVKDEIVAKGICTLLAYSDAKQAIVEELLAKARAWHS